MSPLSPVVRRSLLLQGRRSWRQSVWAISRSHGPSWKGLRLATTSSQVDEPLPSPATSKDLPDDTHWKEFEAAYFVPRKLRRLPTSIHRQYLEADEEYMGRAEGFLNRIVTISKDMTFAHIDTPEGSVQVLCRQNSALNKNLKSIPIGSAVRAIGSIREKESRSKQARAEESTPLDTKQAKTLEKNRQDRDNGYLLAEDLELHLTQIDCLNSFVSTTQGNPTDPSIKHPSESRHLQIRFDAELSKRLEFRANAVKAIRHQLHTFVEVETPVLFKSTPEGAREFLVPTRRKGYAYALPQSPQQYKQILMASGISKYFQFARCFRDEDLRADRQPEFTQLDLEMAWVDGLRVMKQIEEIIFCLYGTSNLGLSPKDMIIGDKTKQLRLPSFPVLTYHEAMSWYGSDKPDLRINGKISNVSRIVPLELQKMMTGLEHADFDAWRFRGSSQLSVKQLRKFISRFLDSADGKEFRENPAGAPGVFIFDKRAPLEGLQAFGYEGAQQLKDYYWLHHNEFNTGDLLLVQARNPGPFYGGSTMLGKLRLAIYKAAIAEGLITQKPGHHYLWVTDFPMFTPDNDTDPGQGGTAGFSATHHPFTAPKSLEDLKLLRTDPLAAKADHYDLVVNGVELGGGSRRIHNAEIQRYVMRDVLKMSEERINDFSHLLGALSSGCPPHAGFAIGFDRLIAVLTGRESVKDVIAFPKSSKGEDMMVKSPSLVLDKALATYHLQLRQNKKEMGDGQPVPTALEDSKIGDPVTKEEV